MNTETPAIEVPPQEPDRPRGKSLAEIGAPKWIQDAVCEECREGGGFVNDVGIATFYCGKTNTGGLLDPLHGPTGLWHVMHPIPVHGFSIWVNTTCNAILHLLKQQQEMAGGSRN